LGVYRKTSLSIIIIFGVTSIAKFMNNIIQD